MAATKISQLTALSTLDQDDWLVVVDRSDTTMAPTGTDKKAVASKFLDCVLVAPATDGTDQTEVIQDGIDAAVATGGPGILRLVINGPVVVLGQLTIPNDGASTPHQKPLSIIGNCSQSNILLNLPTKYLDMRYAGGPKILSLGVGQLNIQGISFRDTTDGTQPFIKTTNTTPHIIGNTFIGLTANTTVQDAIICGGYSTVTAGTVNDPFQGYQAILNNNCFQRVRRCIVGRTYFNGNVIAFNQVGTQCGGPTSATFTVDTGTNVINLSSNLQLDVGDVLRLTTSGTLPAGLNLVSILGYDYNDVFIKTMPTPTTATLSAERDGTELDITTSGSGVQTATLIPGAFEFRGSSNSGDTGNTLLGNLVEMTNYVYGVRISDGTGNTFHNNFFDSHAGILGFYRFDSKGWYNDIIGGCYFAAYPEIEEHLNAVDTNSYRTTQQSQDSKFAGPTLFTGNPTIKGRLVISANAAVAPMIQPALAQIDGSNIFYALRSAAESSNPGTVIFLFRQNGSLVLGGDAGGNIEFIDEAGVSRGGFSDLGSTWSNGGSGHMEVNTGTGGSYFKIKAFAQDFRDHNDANTWRLRYGTNSPQVSVTEAVALYVQVNATSGGNMLWGKIGASSDTGWAPVGSVLESFSVGSLPSASIAGRMIYVTDETGGAVPAFADGVNFRRVTDRAIVS